MMTWGTVFTIISFGMAGGVATYVVLAPVEWVLKKLKASSGAPSAS